MRTSSVVAACLIAAAVSSAISAAVDAALLPSPPSPSSPPSLAARSSPSTAPSSLLIVHAQPLAEVAAEWKAYRERQGWRVSLLPWSGDDPELLRRAIHDAIPMRAGNAVLLLGDVPAKPGDAGLPTFHFDQPDPLLVDRRDPRFASDGPYQDFDGDGVPDIMLGRVPVAEQALARGILAKIRTAESRAPCEASLRVELVGGEGRFGPYDALLELLTASLLMESVPHEFTLRASYVKASSLFCPPPSQLRPLVRDMALSGALLFNYVGHGHARGLDRLIWDRGNERILDVPDLAIDGTLHGFEPGGVALLVCCSTGWYDLPQHPSFAEALLAAPTGPVAIIAGSRQTHPYANAFVERDGIRSLLRDRPATAGEWDLAITRELAKASPEALDLIARPIAASQRWKLTLREIRRQHSLLYNLIGDPTTRIVYPPRTVPGSISLRDRRVVEGTIANADGAEAEVFLVQARDAVRADMPAPRPGELDLEARALRDWARANDWTLWRSSAPVRDGRFEVTLPDPLPERAEFVIVRVIRRSPAPSVAMPAASPAPGSAPVSSAGGAPPHAPAELLAIESIPIPRLLRSGRNGQGLPPDRGLEPR